METITRSGLEKGDGGDAGGAGGDALFRIRVCDAAQGEYWNGQMFYDLREAGDADGVAGMDFRKRAKHRAENDEIGPFALSGVRFGE